MNSIKIQDVLRAGHVKRWNIVNTTRQQPLSEHLFNVAMISRTIVEKLGEYDISNITMDWALIHDVPEVVCGDMPSPTKKRMEEIAHVDMEEIYDHIDPTYKEVKGKALDIKEGMPYDIVKIADLIEAIHFLRDHGIGNHAKSVKDGLLIKLTSVMGKFGNRHYNIVASRMEAMDVINSIFIDIMDGEIYE